MKRLLALSVMCLVLPLITGAQGKSRKPDLLVRLKFDPQEAVPAGPLALPRSLLDRSVAIRVQDSRQQTDPLQIGQGTDDDDRVFSIRASSDITKWVGDAVSQVAREAALKKSSPPERILQIRLTRFTVNESNKAVGSMYSADVRFTYALTDPSGTVLAEGEASGAANRYGRARSAANCSEVLSDALKEGFTSTLGDQTLQAGWALNPLAGKAQPRAGAGQKETVEERLRQLDDLLKKGLISEAEYKARRAEILKEL